MKLQSLSDVFHHELTDLYSAEKQLAQALPKLAKAASSRELQNAFEQHLDQTKQHATRLEEIGEKLDIKVNGETCEAMKGLIKEGESLMKDNEAGEALDAALIAAAQRVEHYEIAAYGSARTFAKHLGHEEAARLLDQTLDEESATDEKLTRIAEGGGVNTRAEA